MAEISLMLLVYAQLVSVPYALNAKTVEQGDNLGNHVPQQKIYRLTNNWLSNDGDDEGISVDQFGHVSITSTTSTSLLIDSNGGAAAYLRLRNNSDQWNISSSGDYLAIENDNTENQVVKIENNAASNSIFISDNGSVGISTSYSRCKY